MDLHDYDLHWLIENNGGHNYTKFVHRKFREADNVRNTIRPHLSAAISAHHIHLDRIAGWLKDLGYNETATKIVETLPSDKKTRKGNFGEVVASEHLIQRHGYYMPVFKLRFRDSKLPMRGEDIIAFIQDAHGSITKICIGEAKAIESFTSQKVLDAHERLDKTYRPYPETLNLIVEILYSEGNNKLAGEVDRIIPKLAAKEMLQENWIFIITGNAPDDPFCKIEELDSVVPALFCIHIHLPDLDAFVTDLFQNPGIP